MIHSDSEKSIRSESSDGEFEKKLHSQESILVKEEDKINFTELNKETDQFDKEDSSKSSEKASPKSSQKSSPKSSKKASSKSSKKSSPKSSKKSSPKNKEEPSITKVEESVPENVEKPKPKGFASIFSKVAEKTPADNEDSSKSAVSRLFKGMMEK